MAYTSKDFKTKKALKEAVKAGEHSWLRVFIAGDMFPATQNGRTCIEGPQFPKAHAWYAAVDVKDGYVVKVVS